jgi:hypothetical protein
MKVKIMFTVSVHQGLENRDYGREDPLRWPCEALYQLKLALTSPTGCGRSVGIVCLWTKTTEFSFKSVYLPKSLIQSIHNI